MSSLLAMGWGHALRKDRGWDSASVSLAVESVPLVTPGPICLFVFLQRAWFLQGSIVPEKGR